MKKLLRKYTIGIILEDMKNKMLTVYLYLLFFFLNISYSQVPTKYVTYENLPECDYENLIMPVTPEEQAYLVYFDYYNGFDSSFVENSVGEFTVLDSSGRIIKLLYFTEAFNFLNRLTKVWGENNVGTDSILTQLSRTIPFTYPENSKVRFFRFTKVATPCNKWREPDSTAFRDWWEQARLAIPNSILDTSVWVIQLVRLADHSVIFTLDSIAVLPNGNSWVAPFVGREPDKSTHVVNLPNEYAYDSVYLRVEVRRFGPTPFGMELITAYIPSICPLSKIYDYGPNNELGFSRRKCNLNYDSLSKILFVRLARYFDSVKTANGGTLPDYIYEYPYNIATLAHESEVLADSLERMCDIRERARIIYSSDTVVSRKMEKKKIIVYEPIPQNLGNKNYLLKVKILCRADMFSGFLVLQDIRGRFLEKINVKLVKGLNFLEIPIENIASQWVGLMLISDDNTPCSYTGTVLLR